jgi:hypothetical protein
MTNSIFLNVLLKHKIQKILYTTTYKITLNTRKEKTTEKYLLNNY